jgi:Spy/CpxP family protein refolding chaperone
MNRWIRKTVMPASIAGALALGVGGIAVAQQAPSHLSSHLKGHHPHHPGLIGEALKLDSLTPEQRAAVVELAAARRSARTPVRQADARVLSQLAQQVEQASIDEQALATNLSAEHSAAVAESAADKDTLGRLHALLTPAQRNALVDDLEAEHARARHAEHGADGGRGEHGGLRAWEGKLGLTPAQKSQIVASLRAEHHNGAAPPPDQERRSEEHSAVREAIESFRGDSFAPDALVRVEHRGERVEMLARAMVPVLTPAQRAHLGELLRERAAKEGA